jgi:hypothetical protein
MYYTFADIFTKAGKNYPKISGKSKGHNPSSKHA